MSFTFAPFNKEIEKRLDAVPDEDCATLSNMNTYAVLEALGYPTGNGCYGEYDPQDMAQRLEENQDPTNVMKISDRHYHALSHVVNKAMEKHGKVCVC